MNPGHPHQVNWFIGGPPSVKGWYIVMKKGYSSPALLQWNSKATGSWDRVLAWDGPLLIPVTEVKVVDHPTCLG